MTFDEIKAIGVRNLLTDASLRNLSVERESFLAKWALSMAWYIASTENMGEDLVSALSNAKTGWISGTVPNWTDLLDLIK